MNTLGWPVSAFTFILLFVMHPFDGLAAGKERKMSQLVSISIEDSTRAKLPGAEISVDLEGTGFSASRLPDAHTYLRLSGPPGAPLGVVIEGTSLSLSDGKSLDRFVRDARGTELAFEFGKQDSWSQNGRAHPAVTFGTGESLSRASHCSVLYPDMKSPSSGAVIVTFSLGSRQLLSCEEILRSPALLPIVRSLKVSFR